MEENKIESKIIDNNTKIEQQAIQFLNGEEGFFQQDYQVFINGKKTEMFVCVTGGHNKKTKRTFIIKNKTFDTAKAAFEAMGYKMDMDEENK